MKKVKFLGIALVLLMVFAGCQLDTSNTKGAALDETPVLAPADSIQIIKTTNNVISELCGPDTQEDSKASVVTTFYDGDHLTHTSRTFYYSGAYRDLRDYTWDNGNSMDNDITSFKVPAGYEINACAGYNFRGTTKSFPANSPGTHYSMITNNFDNIISSVEIIQRKPYFQSYSYLSSFPSDRQNGWSNECQGVTNDGDYWYISTKWNIRKIHKSENLNSSHNDKKIINRPFSNSKNHIGDITYYDGCLYVPVEHCPGDEYKGDDRIYVYNSSGTFQRYGILTSQSHASWVAINPYDYHMLSSDFKTDRIYVYSPYFSSGSNITPLYYIQLDRTLSEIQGGVVGPNGYLYLSNSHSPGGVWVFRIRGGYATMVKYIEPKGYKPGGTYGEEVEGLTWWDLDSESGVNSNLKGGQLHWLLLDNDLTSDDDIYFKHVRITF
jgi:hypothetical protein